MTTTRFQSQTQEGAELGVPKVHVVTFGCQMNKYDSALAEGRFRARGYVTTATMGDADVILFNTCSVREHAEERTYSWLGEIKRAKEARPELVIGVMDPVWLAMGVLGIALSVGLVIVARRPATSHRPCCGRR